MPELSTELMSILDARARVELERLKARVARRPGRWRRRMARGLRPTESARRGLATAA